MSVPSGLDSKTLFDISGKSVLVTGGGQGIGYMIAKTFISCNAKHVRIDGLYRCID